MRIKIEDLAIGLASLLIGIIISILMKTNLELYTPITLRSIQNTKNEITAINDEIEDLKEMINQKKDTLEVFKNISRGEESIIDILIKENEDNRLRSGHIPLEGPGIVIKMFDNPEDTIVGFDINDDIIHDVDILNILNDLRIAGAEAISINGERVLSTSEIECAGPVIKINREILGAPFIIRAIGDPKQLYASVSAPGTYGELLSVVYQLGFEPKVEDRVYIPAYSKDFYFQYAKPQGEGDI